MLYLPKQMLWDMDIQSTKLELMRMLLNTQKESVLERLKKVFEDEEGTDFWDELDPDLRTSVERGLRQSANGQVKSHEEVMKKYSKWL